MRATRPSPRTRATTHTIHFLVYTAALALFELAPSALPVHHRLVSLSRCHSRAIGVLFCRAFLFVRPRLLGGPKIVPGRDDRRRLRLGVGIESRRLPVHVWRCRRPSPYGGLDPLRRETSTATVAIHASGGRCSTRPCAHAIGPSSFSAVRRQVWLSCPSTRTTPQGEKSSLVQ